MASKAATLEVERRRDWPTGHPGETKAGLGGEAVQRDRERARSSARWGADRTGWPIDANSEYQPSCLGNKVSHNRLYKL